VSGERMGRSEFGKRLAGGAAALSLPPSSLVPAPARGSSRLHGKGPIISNLLEPQGGEVACEDDVSGGDPVHILGSGKR
jgi:hypothetical protein